MLVRVGSAAKFISVGVQDPTSKVLKDQAVTSSFQDDNLPNSPNEMQRVVNCTALLGRIMSCPVQGLCPKQDENSLSHT